MNESFSDSEQRLSYHAPEIRSLGTIAEITAAGPGSGWDSHGYSSDEHSHHSGPRS